jgi:hypothetical protein
MDLMSHKDKRDIINCKKMLLDAGADANLRNSQARIPGFEFSAIMVAVSELHLVSLTLVGIMIATSFNAF